jgi:hypothetical protein
VDVPDINTPSTNPTPKSGQPTTRQKIGQGLKNIAALPLAQPGNNYNPAGSGLESAPIGNVGNPFAIQNQPAAQYNPFAGVARG